MYSNAIIQGFPMFELSVIHLAEICVIAAVLLLLLYVLYRLDLLKKE